tara:strand:+ start:2502 stop:2879 length:378 start_codon:yes stop_codon:yes gene_type:complete
MNSLIIDTAGDKIFLKIITDDKEYIINHDNCRENFDKLVSIIFNFLSENNISLSTINNVFINQGPGKNTSVRSAISIAKALKISNKINIYGYENAHITNNNYDNLLNLKQEGRLTKDFIQPKYSN